MLNVTDISRFTDCDGTRYSIDFTTGWGRTISPAGLPQDLRAELIEWLTGDEPSTASRTGGS